MDPTDLFYPCLTAFLTMLALFLVIYGLVKLLEWQDARRQAKERVRARFKRYVYVRWRCQRCENPQPGDRPTGGLCLDCRKALIREQELSA